MRHILTYNGIRPLEFTAEELYHHLIDFGSRRAILEDAYPIVQQLIDHPNVLFKHTECTTQIAFDVFGNGSESYLKCVDLAKQLDDHMRVNLTVVVERINNMGDYLSLKCMVSKSDNIIHLYRKHTIDEILKDLA